MKIAKIPPTRDWAETAVMIEAQGMIFNWSSLNDRTPIDNCAYDWRTGTWSVIQNRGDR